MSEPLESSSLLTRGEVARELGVSPSRVRRFVEAGRLTPALETSIARFYAAQDVAQFARERAERRTPRTSD